jgi:hypothetical protein
MAPSASQPAARQARMINEANGLALTLPEDWLGITPATANNPDQIAALRAISADQSRRVDVLINALNKHPEYWFAAMRDSDQAVVTGQLRTFDDFKTWRGEQQSALEQAYGKVGVQYVKVPRDGWLYGWVKNGLYFELIAFERKGGAALFSFGGPTSTTGLPALWDEVFATFTDADAVATGGT